MEFHSIKLADIDALSEAIKNEEDVMKIKRKAYRLAIEIIREYGSGITSVPNELVFTPVSKVDINQTYNSPKGITLDGGEISSYKWEWTRKFEDELFKDD